MFGYPDMKNILLTLLLAIMNVPALWAQPYCDVHTYTIRDGLASSNVSGILQTREGLMWFSTWNGLCCYDGYRFTTFRNRPGVDDVLSTNRLFLIRQSANGDVWCCSYDRRAYLFDTRRCRFIDVCGIIKEKYGIDMSVRSIYSLENGHTWLVNSFDGPNCRIDDAKLTQGDGAGAIEMFGKDNGNLRTNGIRKVELDGDGREWVFDNRGVTLLGGKLVSDVLFEYMAQIGKSVFFASPDADVRLYNAADGRLRRVALPSEVTKVNAMMPLDGHRMLFATDAGIVVCGESGGGMRTFAVRTPLQPSPVAVDAYVDSRHRVWASTEGAGVVMIDVADGETQWLMPRTVGLMERTVSAWPIVHEDGYGTVWVAPRGGTFSYYDEAARRLEPYLLTSAGGSGVLPEIVKYGTDREKNLWFTGTRDVNLANFKLRRFRYTPVRQGQDVRSMFTDSHGRIWAGTVDGHIAVYDNLYRRIGFVDPSGRISEAAVKFANRIYAMLEDHRGRIWVATKGSGLYMLRPEGGVEHYTNDPADPYSLCHNDLYDMLVDRQGRIWVASFEGGLNLIDEHDGRIRFVNDLNRLKNYPKDKYFRKIRRITTDGKGTVILSTSSGLVTFADRFDRPENIRFHTTGHVKGDTTSLLAADVLQTLVTRDGKVIVATLGGGVQQMTSSDALHDGLKFSNLTGVKPDESIVQSVAEDNSGRIWIIRESGIERYDPSTGALSQYGPNDIGHNVEMSEAEPMHNRRTDVITLGAWGGLVSFNPADMKKSDNCPSIVFTGVRYQGENETEPLLNRELLDVPSDRRNLTVYFAALEYSDKYLVKYAYKLDGVDEKWNYTGADNSASFNYLPAGHYKLLVKSTNCDGVWMDNVTELSIYAHPTFWETGWAKLLYFLLFCGMICLAVYIYNLRARARLERELSDMKTGFFTEISHKLRTPLTLIGGPVAEVLDSTSLTESARRHLEMVQRNARQMLELVNRMLKYNMDRGVYISDDVTTAVEEDTQEPSSPSEQTGETATAGHNGGEKILVVEDNDDLRDFLVSILKDKYTVFQAENGQRGLDIAAGEMPDFIITDVTMPVMDGLTMVRHIKRNSDICHIPIIVLSAKASLEDRLQGLKEGIDDYITKPFSALYLKSRVSNIIRQRHHLQQAYVEQLKPEDDKTYRLEAPQIVDADNAMMKKLLEYLESRVGDPSLKIEDLADAVNLGRSVFYGKIKSIVGMSPVDFVRHIRMQRAEELITKSSYPFSQIAYMVGYSDPKYFSKCFKKETGMTPSEYRDKAEA